MAKYKVQVIYRQMATSAPFDPNRYEPFVDVFQRRFMIFGIGVVGLNDSVATHVEIVSINGSRIPDEQWVTSHRKNQFYVREDVKVEDFELVWL